MDAVERMAWEREHPPIVVQVQPVAMFAQVTRQARFVTAHVKIRLKRADKDGATFLVYAEDEQGIRVPCGPNGSPEIVMDFQHEAAVEIPVSVEDEDDDEPGPTNIVVQPEAVAITTGVQGEPTNGQEASS